MVLPGKVHRIDKELPSQGRDTDKTFDEEGEPVRNRVTPMKSGGPWVGPLTRGERGQWVVVQDG